MRIFGARSPRRFGAAAMARPAPILTLLCGLAFLFQAFIAQTHIHVPGVADGAVSYGAVATGVQSPAKAPDQNQRDDLSKCPFCQVAMALGATVGPSVFYVLQPPTSGVVEALREQQRPVRIARSYIWRSRGPPQH